MNDNPAAAEAAVLHSMYPTMATPAAQPEPPPDPAMVAFYPTMATAEQKAAAARARPSPPAAPAAPVAEKPTAKAEADQFARSLSAAYPTMTEPAKVDPSAVASYALTLPAEVQADDPLLGRYKELAVRHKLPPTVASELLALHAEAAGVPQHWHGAEAWEAEAMALPEMRNGGAEAVAAAAALADPETKAFLLESGLGNHPQLVKWAAKIGRELQRLRGGRR